jgi:hypothetical protein
MSAKPSKVARWAETSPGVTSGSIVEPTSGKKDIGFVGGERPCAEHLGWLFSLAYEWQQYLSDGAFTGAISSDTSFSAPAVKYTTALARQLNHMSSSDNASATSGATHTRGLQQWILAASATPIYWPIPNLIPGDVISAYTIDYRKLTSSGTCSSDIVYEATTGTGSGTPAETSATGSPASNNGNAPGLINLGQSGLNITVVGGRQYYVKVTPTGGVTPSADRVDEVNVSWSHP